MRASLNNATTADTYTDANTLRLPRTRRIGLQVANAAVVYQLDESEEGKGQWTDEAFLAPVVGNIARLCSGIRFRSALAGTPAQVTCELLDDDGADSLSAFTSIVGADGAVSTGPTMITGRVNADGTIAGGTGFTVAFNGLDTYTITFTTPYAAIPAVVVHTTNGTLQGTGLSGVTASQFVVKTPGATAAPFNFLAVPIA